MTTHSITIDLPDALYRYLEQVSRAMRKPLEQVVEQSIAGNMPPALADVPVELAAELAELQHMSPADLRRVLESEVPAEAQARHLELLDANSTGTLTDPERDELAHLRHEADQLMLRKAYAAAVLRWLGGGLPAAAGHERQ